MKTRKKKNNELERKEQSMPRLNNTSNFLNASHLLEVLHKLKEAGVNTMGQKLRGYRLLSAVRGQNTLHDAFLNLALPILAKNILCKCG